MATPTRDPLPQRAEAVLIAGALGAGTLARVAWLADKPFWRDEAWVAAAVRAPLAGALERNEPVPIGFLVLLKLLGRLPLEPEVSLRLLPLLAGTAAVLAVPALARALKASRGVCAATAWITAGMPALIYYSRELKPYSIDLLLSALVPTLAVRVFGTADTDRRPRVAPLLAVLAVTPWISFAGALVAAATLAAVSRRAWRERGDRLWLLAAMSVAATSAGAVYAFVVRAQVARAVRYLDYLTGDGSAAGLVSLMPYLFRDTWPAAAGLAVLGLAALGAGRRTLAMVLAAAIGAAPVAAALAGVYTLSQTRVLLFLAPWPIFLAATGLETLLSAVARRRAAAVPAVGLLVSLLGIGFSLHHRRAPYRDDRRDYFVYDVFHDVEPLIRVTAERATKADDVYASRFAGEPFRYYARGRLHWALVCSDAHCHDERPAFELWLGGVGARAFVVLLAEEDRPWRRRLTEAAGLEMQVIATARGTLLWELRRR